MADFTNTPIILQKQGMDLQTTLFCGQSFSWRQETATNYIGIAGPYGVRLVDQGLQFSISNLSEEPVDPEEKAFWTHYFALDIDYPALVEKFCQHKILGRCVEKAPGIRVLRQTFFETLIGFIISQNNHIPRITGIVNRLREEYGTLVAQGIYTFPRADQLACLTPEDLAPLRAGFRARYIIDAAQKVTDGTVDEARLRGLPVEEARKELCRITGVGTKVADCVLLYSLGHNTVVPMDVWMKRAMTQHFPKGMPRVAKGNEGIAQQFIFHWMRQQNDISVKDKKTASSATKGKKNSKT